VLVASLPQGRSYSALGIALFSRAWSRQFRVMIADQPHEVVDRHAPARAATLSLLARRTPGATICPSEVARAIAPDWRGAMPTVHAAIDGLVRDGLVRLSWKGRPLTTRSGPYRIGRRGDD
jgi:hypothetical protein